MSTFIVEDNRKLFDWIFNTIIGEGGDGDAVIGFRSQDYLQVAEEFRGYLPESWKKVVNENTVVFMNDQEYLILTSADYFPSVTAEFPRILTW